MRFTFSLRPLRETLFTIPHSLSYLRPKIVILLSITQANLIIGQPFTEIGKTGSTNSLVLDLIRQGFNVTHGATWMTHEQTEGRGQRTKVWLSQPCQNIAMSIAIKQNITPLVRQFELSIIVALSIYDTLKKEYDDCKIKWPNDIYCGGNKICGILIENIIHGNCWEWAVLGIGININQILFDPSIPNVTSLKLLTGKDYDTVSFAKEVCANIQKRYILWQNENFETILEEYNSALFKRGEKVRLKKDEIVFDCVIEKVDSKGFLYVSGTTHKKFTFGEVIFVG